MSKSKENKADIWMPFYVGDYLADTMHLSAAEHGGYLMLMLHYWKSGPIPDDDAQLAIITRLGDAWSNASSKLRAFFEHRDGMLVHERIDREKNLARDNNEKNQARAKAAADKRWGNNAKSNAPSNAQAMRDECPSPSPSPSSSLKPEIQNHVAFAPEFVFGAEVDEMKTPEDRLAESVIRSALPPSRGDAGGEVRTVFTYWQKVMGHNRAHLDTKREKNIKARLKDGYSVEDLCRAVDGCKLSPHHMGQNDTRTVYDDIELICRDGSKVDKFMALVARGADLLPTRTTNQQTTMDNLKAYLEQHHEN